MTLHGLNGHAQEWGIVVVQLHFPDKTLCQWKILGHQECHVVEVVNLFQGEIEEGVLALLRNPCP